MSHWCGFEDRTIECSRDHSLQCDLDAVYKSLRLVELLRRDRPLAGSNSEKRSRST